MSIRSVASELRALPPRRVDAALAAALAAMAVGDLLLGVGVLAEPGGWRGWMSAVVALVLTLPLARRRSHPELTMSIVGTAGIVMVIAGVPTTFAGVFGIMVALYSIVAHGDDTAARGSGVVTLLVLLYVGIALWGRVTVAEIIANYVLFATAWVLGFAARSRRLLLEQLEARAAEAERRRVEEARAAVVSERGRIARELHDVIAHTVSVMVVQAGAARRVASRRPEQVDEALAAIETTGREALIELRRLLGVLRTPADAVDVLAPQPTVASIDELVRTLQDSGLPIEVVITGTPRALPQGVEVSTYRIVQESLTNVLKHAGPVRRVLVRLHYDDGSLEARIWDDGQGAASAASHEHRSGSRAGILGMRERAAMLGGTLAAGPRPGGGFEVVATLPTTASSPSSPPAAVAVEAPS